MTRVGSGVDRRGEVEQIAVAEYRVVGLHEVVGEVGGFAVGEAVQSHLGQIVLDDDVYASHWLSGENEVMKVPRRWLVPIRLTASLAEIDGVQVQMIVVEDDAPFVGGPAQQAEIPGLTERVAHGLLEARGVADVERLAPPSSLT